jgi:hypothetical protein
VNRSSPLSPPNGTVAMLTPALRESWVAANGLGGSSDSDPRPLSTLLSRFRTVPGEVHKLDRRNQTQVRPILYSRRVIFLKHDTRRVATTVNCARSTRPRSVLEELARAHKPDPSRSPLHPCQSPSAVTRSFQGSEGQLERGAVEILQQVVE